MDAYTIRNLTFSYPEQRRRVLDNLSFAVKQGEFIVLCGPSGCGKTTLLKHLKTVLAPHGKKTGEILFTGKALEQLDQREQSSQIGFVLQSPDNQIVTDKVWHELAFGLESLGFDTPTIRLRVAEMASFFGIQNWFYKDVSELSGGQKQLLNLASIMAMQPQVLILDEPTSQLDPIAAAEFLATVGKINRELGTTVIMTEHRLEEAFPLANRVLVMDEGRLLCEGSPEEVGEILKTKEHGMFLAMPVPMRIYGAVENTLPCPVTVREGREWLQNLARERPLRPLPPVEEHQPPPGVKPIISMDEVWFRYSKEGQDVVKGLSLEIYSGEFFALVGGNGTGKTTSLSLLSGLNKPYRGKILIKGQPISNKILGTQLGVLPQNPQTLFVRKTVAEDLQEVLNETKLSKEERETKIENIAKLCRITGLLARHPYDLSGGEQQRAALAKVLLLEPSTLLLDEPTKGMDSEFKQAFATILQDLLAHGVTIFMVSHDVEFCASYAHRCALFFDGSIVSMDIPRRFFSGNSFYTTAANRMARHLLPQATTAEDVIFACGGEKEPWQLVPRQGKLYQMNEGEETKKAPESARISAPRRMLLMTAIIMVATSVFFLFQNRESFQVFLGGGAGATNLATDTSLVWTYVLLMLLLVAGICLGVWALRGNSNLEPIDNEQVEPEKRKLSSRTLAAMVIILLTIPLTIYIGIYYLGDRKYYFISLLIILQIMLPFVLAFEKRNPQARELIVIAVLCAIAVAGRTAFFMLPQFKPVVAIVIIAGVAFGGEAGFLVGAMTAFVSNMFFGQGPWTPWQMFAFGLIGFLAGVLFRKGFLRRNHLALSIFGGLATFFIYGGIMNPASVIMFQARPVKEMFYLAYIQGIPFDLVHAAATVTFLWLISRPMLEKLDRIKVKYGLLESNG